MINDGFFDNIFGGEKFNNYPTTSFPLIGVYKGVWYPTINDFKIQGNVKYKILKYNEDNGEEANKIINFTKYNRYNAFWIHTILELLTQ